MRIVAGKPLIRWTIDTAVRFTDLGFLDDPMVSTEDPEIAEYAGASLGIPVLDRPQSLSTDEATGTAVAVHAATWGIEHGYEWLIYLQPTCPLRAVEDIERGCDLMLKRGASVAVVDRPCYSLQIQTTIEANGHGYVVGDDPIVCRSAMQLRGLFWGGRWSDIIEHRSVYCAQGQAVFFVPEERALDIDTEYDLHLADLLLREVP